MSTVHPKPPYYDRVAARARGTCQLLADQPDLSGAWNLLFEQIQNPKFVISELLQNADDAGATHAEVELTDSTFVFSHNGQDFNEDQFASLCRFGFSNKRTIHTIGFRGIGFKSTFSLGHRVEVWSPTLGVAFSAERFIEPHWIHDGRPVTDTFIKVRLDHAGAFQDVRQSLESWKQSPASLLFFNNIRKLTLNGQVIQRTETKTRIPGVFSVELAGKEKQSLYLIRSAEEAFPPAAIEEIRKARQMKDVADLHLSGCKVEVVVGLKGDQHLFVVLPTGEPLAVPFSVNAPFLLKPDRFDIKPPSTSPTNSWLLDRAARLVAETVLSWLGNDSFSLARRVEAYRLLPDPQAQASVAASALRDGIITRLRNQRVVLNCYEKLCDPGATAVPPPLFNIWSPKQVRGLFCPDDELLSPEIDYNSRLVLTRLGWAKSLSPDDILTKMASAGSLPKPDTWQKLGDLWKFVIEHQPKWDWDSSRKRSYPIVPVVNQEDLLPASGVVRISTRTDTLSAETVQWLTGRTPVFDLRWHEWIASKLEGKEARESFLALLRTLQLHEPTPVNRLVEQTAASVFARDKVDLEECVQLAQLFAALRASTPRGFHFVSRDLYRRTSDHGLVYDITGDVEALVPESWAKAHILHEDYDDFVRCTADEWNNWVRSPASGLFQGLPILPQSQTIYGKHSLSEFLSARNSSLPTTYPYKYEHFTISDFNLHPDIVGHLSAVAAKDHSIWHQALQSILLNQPHCWKDRLTADAHQVATTGNRQPLACSAITAQWIALFRDKPCLADTHNQLRLPVEVYRRTPDTDPLQGNAEFRFVKPEMDDEATRPVLRLLGVLDTPADYTKIVKRLDALRSVAVTPAVFASVSTFYQILDRIVARCRPAERLDLETIFSTRPLILAADQSWQTASELSVFSGDEETPDPGSFIHPSFQGFHMWTRLGVSQHPSVGQTIDWLVALKTGQRLDGADYKRVRRALTRDPLRVWQECGHWMSLDLTWEPVSRFTHRLTMQGLAPSAHLMSGVKQCVADLRPLPTHLLLQAPFSDLIELADAIENRVTQFTPARGRDENPPWLVQLADAFRRVNLSEPEKQSRVRASGQRLHQSRWRSAALIELTPYLDQTPAGSAMPVKVAWCSNEIFVVSESAGRLHRAIVEELSAPFRAPEIARAFDCCVGRDDEFIADYIAEHFTLEDIPELPLTETPIAATNGDSNEDAADATGVHPQPIAVAEEIGEDGGNSTEEPISNEPGEHSEPTTKPRPAPEPSIFDRYAASLGFKRAGNGYAHSDGRQIVKSSAPFHWEQIDSRGSCLKRYWSTRDALEDGAEIKAELWSLTQQSPEEIIWILPSAAGVIALTGDQLVSQTATELLKLYISSYTLRQPAPTS
jgi:hypothetical protein